ncbi:hypothetical protein N9Z27_01195 [Alphaproteobacteria bacterium]|nr:hypothetical protein [Alphaproteobacteria bacterium]
MPRFVTENTLPEMIFALAGQNQKAVAHLLHFMQDAATRFGRTNAENCTYDFLRTLDEMEIYDDRLATFFEDVCGGDPYLAGVVIAQAKVPEFTNGTSKAMWLSEINIMIDNGQAIDRKLFLQEVNARIPDDAIRRAIGEPSRFEFP